MPPEEKIEVPLEEIAELKPNECVISCKATVYKSNSEELAKGKVAHELLGHQFIPHEALKLNAITP